MVYKTLHGYILRELLRIFLMTASALTTLMAFGGTFRSFTKQGIEITQLLAIIMDLMPAMLAYAIPIAALFAAVLVYWRMSTDNELTACRASGISFVTMVMPALILGLLVASTDLVFVNYVVPVFLQRTERVITSDLGSLLVSQVGRQENFKFERWVIYSDSAELRPSPDGDPNVSVVIMKGMAATFLKDNKPDKIALADEAECTITDMPEEGSAKIAVKLTNGSLFNAKNFQKASGSIDNLSQIDGRSLIIPSFLKSKPKFLNLRQLFNLNKYPTKFPPVADVIEHIRSTYIVDQSSRALFDQWNASSGKEPQVFKETALSGAATSFIKVYAPYAQLSPDDLLTYMGGPGNPVRVERWSNGKEDSIYNCDSAEVQISIDEISGTGMSAALQLQSHEVFKVGGLTLAAQSATLIDSADPHTLKISLKSLIATRANKSDGAPIEAETSPDAVLTLSNITADGTADISLEATDIYSLNPATLQIIPGRVEGPFLINGRPFTVPGLLKNKPKPFTVRQLFTASVVTRRDLIRNIGPNPAGAPLFAGLEIPPPIIPPDDLTLRNLANASTSPEMHNLGINLESQIKKLFQNITSELHSRGSFSLSCLTLVLLGAGLGILLRGRNPLAVFVVGSMPAVLLVLLITAGRQLAEGSPKNVPVGIGLIWAGNIILLGIVVGVYVKLLRH